MPASKTAAKTFTAPLERTQDGLGWVIARIPFDAAKIWGKRGQLRVKGEINGFPLNSTLFPNGKGGHFLLVNKKMQKGGKTTAGLVARFRMQPDDAPREVKTPKELLRELGQSKRLLKYYESFNHSTRNWISKWTAEPKSEAARVRRSQQIAERLMETMEAERELPPLIELAFRNNPMARAAWEQASPRLRRGHLLGIFYYRTPESRARRLAKCMEDLLGAGKKGRQEEEFD
jgi:uncharacterized protein YdeI (YjbR/CyaY-like superfamily)